MISHPLQQQQQLISSGAASTSNSTFLTRYQIVLPNAITSLAAHGGNQPLTDGYQPSEFDVVCGRGKGSYNSPGSRRCRDIVRQHIPLYQKARTKFDKSTILNTIIDKVRAQNNGNARFVKMDSKTGSWYEITDDQAREKVGHTIRESIQAIKVAEAKLETRKDFDSKHGSLLAQQQVIFSSMTSQSQHHFKQARTKAARSA